MLIQIFALCKATAFLACSFPPSVCITPQGILFPEHRGLTMGLTVEQEMLHYLAL